MRKEWNKPAIETKTRCHRISCDKPATNGILCKKHDDEKANLKQSDDQYFKRNCVDKSSEPIIVKSKTKFVRPPRERDDD
jgi:hypothetical protein